MADKKSDRAYRIWLAALMILLLLAIALFVYGSATNGIPQPRLPDKGVFALGTTLLHG